MGHFYARVTVNRGADGPIGPGKGGAKMAYSKILIVEDDPTREIMLKNAATIIDALADCYSVKNLSQAKSYIEQNSDISLLIMGWELPVDMATPFAESKNGSILLQIAKERKIKTIVCSSQEPWIKDSSELKGTPVISPTPFETLDKRIKELL